MGIGLLGECIVVRGTARRGLENGPAVDLLSTTAKLSPSTGLDGDS